jgi:alkylhydroperoxidase/carboxymuconolactone decarboxylase family protein YurZ
MSVIVTAKRMLERIFGKRPNSRPNVGLVSGRRGRTEGMKEMVDRSWTSALTAACLAMTLWTAQGSSASAAEPGHRGCAPQESASTVSSASPDALAQLRIECPLLAGIVEKFALRDLGEDYVGTGLNARSGELAGAMDVTASEDIDALRRRAEQALRAGASQFELKEMLYLTAVNAGVPRAIEVTRALSDLLVKPTPVMEPTYKCSDLSIGGTTRQF